MAAAASSVVNEEASLTDEVVMVIGEGDGSVLSGLLR